MIPREEARLLVLGIVALLTANLDAQDDKSYDTSDWIPVRPLVSRTSSEQKKRQTEAGDRVLTLDTPQAQRFFPNEEYGNIGPSSPNQQFLTETVFSKISENARPRKINFHPEYNYQNLAPSSQNVNFYNNDALKQYWKVEQPLSIRTEKKKYNNKQQVPISSSSAAQNYYISNQQAINQRPALPKANEYLNVPNLNPQVPAVNAPNIYEQFNIPFNRTFYESLNPTFINNDFYAAVNNTPQPSSTLRPDSEKDNVQLVYVPVENLKLNQVNMPTQKTDFRQISQQNNENLFKAGKNKQERLLYQPNVYSSNEQLSSQSIYSNLNSQTQRELPLYSQVLQQTLHATKLQQQFKDETPLEIRTTTTPKPDKKRKPHQPPLAVYLSESQADVSEVLDLLKHAKSISVQDTVTPNSPKIFVGPSNLNSPNGYSKFPLPYLNNINGKRVNPKIEQLPFFVAPLNYKAPLGYAKIPLPSPHVGSVVVSTAQQASIPTERTLSYNQDQPSLPEGTYQNTNPSTRFNLGYQSTPSSYFTEQTPNIPAKSTAHPTISSYNEPTRGLSFYEESKVTEIPNINPLELAINEFELDQINNKFQEPKEKHTYLKPEHVKSQTRFDETTTVPVRSRPRTEYADSSTTERSQSRRRGRPRQNVRVSTTTTPPESETERYTVLEEFDSRKANIQQNTEPYQDTGRRSSTPSGYRKYSNIENINEYVQTDLPKPNPGTKEVPTRTFLQYMLDNTDEYIKPLDTTTQRKPTASLYESEDFLRKTEGHHFVTGDGIRYSVPNFELETTTPETSFVSQFDYSTTLRSVTPKHPFDSNEQQYTKQILGLNNNPTEQNEYTYLDNNKEDLRTFYKSQQEFNTLPSQTVSTDQFESHTSKKQNEKPTIYGQQLKDLDNIFSPLQETAVRSLLQPNLLAPSSKQTEASSPQSIYPTKRTQFSSTTEEPFTTVRTRGRTRGRQPTTITSAPKRAVGRRRPTRPTTERVDVESYSNEESARTKSTTRQRFRTRGRPSYTTALERVSTTESELKSFKEPASEFEPTSEKEPQSFMHFDSQFESEPQIFTRKQVPNDDNVKEYHQLYSRLPIDSTEREVTFKYENTGTIGSTATDDIQITLPESDIQKDIQPEITDNNENQIRYQSTARSELRQGKEETTKRPTIRSRIRGRSRFTTTTARSVLSSTYKTTSLSVENDDSNVRFIGEIRPKYNLRKPTTVSHEIKPEASRSRTRNRVRLPERSKISPRPADDEVNGSDGTEQITRRSSVVKTRNRGASHYRPTQNNKRDNDEDSDLAEQNYPKDFLQKLESASKPSTMPLEVENDDDQSLHASINRPKILPLPEELIGFPELNYLPTLDKPHKSKPIQGDKYLDKAPDIEFQTLPSIVSDDSEEVFRELTEVEEAVLNNLEKTQQSEPHEIDSAAEVTDPPTTQAPFTVISATVKSKGKRRGVWKVIRHKVADPLETSESQNYQSVLNAFESIDKIEPQIKKINITENNAEKVKAMTLSTTTTTNIEAFIGTKKPESSTFTSTSVNENIFDSIYEMFGVFKNNDSKTSTEEPIDIHTTTLGNPTFPQEITEESISPTTEANWFQETIFPVSDVSKDDSVEMVAETTLTPKIIEAVPPKKKFEVEPWEMKAVKTSTSTEVSHETEICYKGRCIKAKNKKKSI